MGMRGHRVAAGCARRTRCPRDFRGGNPHRLPSAPMGGIQVVEAIVQQHGPEAGPMGRR